MKQIGQITQEIQQKSALAKQSSEASGHHPNQAAQRTPDLQQNRSTTLTQAKSFIPMKDDQPGKQRIGEALEMFHDSLKVYGRKPEQLESVTKLFMFALADYPVQKIVDAMAYYVRNFTEFPAPADIVQIIERGNKPPLDRAVYTSLSKKDPSHRNSEDWAYLRDYEKFHLYG